MAPAKSVSRLFLIIAAALFVFAPGRAHAVKSDTQALRDAFDSSVKAEGTKPGDFTLFDQDGAEFRLSEYFNGGRPLVVSFIYTSCPVVCPAITAEFKKAVDEARSKFGDRFSVLSIGFDAENDTPERLREYGRRFTGDFKRFRFAGGDKETIERMTKAFGFFYRKKADGSFDHIDMATALRPDGTIYRQVYSLRTQPEKLAARLDELITGRPALEPGASLIDRLRYFCYKYDPYTGRYAVDYSVFAGVGIQLTVILTIIYAVWGGRIRGFFRKK